MNRLNEATPSVRAALDYFAGDSFYGSEGVGGGCFYPLLPFFFFFERIVKESKEYKRAIGVIGRRLAG